MNTKQIKHAALAAAILAGTGMAYGNDQNLHVVFCKATIVGDSAETVVSVTLPPTEGYYDRDGNPMTYWNVGNVSVGGVADSWHGEGGPGRFTAHNEGNVSAYLYVMTAGWNSEYGAMNRSITPNDFAKPEYFIGGGNWKTLQSPSISPSELLRRYPEYDYHLAFTTDTMAKVPTWHSLDHWNAGGYDNWGSGEEIPGSGDRPPMVEVGGYMGYVDAGDYLTFDLKFWAPREGVYGESLLFTFCLEASTFPLWEHGRALE